MILLVMRHRKIIPLAVRSVRGEGIKNKDNSSELSCLVDKTIELSNPFIEGYMAVVEFAKDFL